MFHGVALGVAAPYATGGGGIVLEHRYGAVLLASLLTGDPLPELGDDAAVQSVRFQASAVSPVDDLVVVGRTPDGGERQVSIGVRRRPALARSDPASVHLLEPYLRVVSDDWDRVQAGRRRLALAVASPNTAVNQTRNLAVVARASLDNATFRREVGRQGRVNAATRGRLSHLDALVNAAAAKTRVQANQVGTDELTWRLLSALRLRELRLEDLDETDRTVAIARLRMLVSSRTVDAAHSLFARLVDLVGGYAPVGATVTETVLLRDLSGTPISRKPAAGEGAPPASREHSFGTELAGGNRAQKVDAWDPISLGVHQPISADAPCGLPVLPPFVSRSHDQELAAIFADLRRSLMVVLIGTSATGKTRSAYEALRRFVPDWPLYRPTEARELLDSVKSIPPDCPCVLWLDEAQVFLDNDHGPAVAAALRRLLEGAIGPVIVIATVWPSYWNELSRDWEADRPTVSIQVSMLLRQANRIFVPATFDALDQVPSDPRWAAAVAHAGPSRQVIQVLAGGRLLVDRYERPGDSTARRCRALLTAAMDAHRLGLQSPAPEEYLRWVTPAYLGSAERAAGEQWFAESMAQATQSVRGIVALAALRGQSGVGPPDSYSLHDFLKQ
jgi:hypothetical protein